MFKLRRYLAGHYLECIIAPTFKMLEAFLQLLVPFVMAQVIDTGIAHNDQSFILWHGALLVVMGIGAWIVSVIAQYYCSKLAAAFGTAMRDDLFHHVMDLSREDIDLLGRASLTTRITNDSQQVQDGLNMFFRLVLRSPFVTFGTVIAAFAVDGTEGVVLLLAVIISFALVMGFMKITTARYRQIQHGMDDVLLKTTENLEGVRVLRAFRREKSESNTFAFSANHVRTMQVSTGDISAWVNPLTYTAINCGLIALLWFGGLHVNSGSMTQGQLVALVSYVAQALIELVKMANLIILLSKASACAKRVNEVFDTKPSQIDGSEALIFDPHKPAVAFDNVSFSYPGAGGQALSQVSFSVKPGSTLGIIGGTGSGKSTVANLLMRFYDASQGHVLVGNTDIRDLKCSELRQHISIVEQGATLFSGTIASNLRWGQADASDAQLTASLATAQATDVVAAKEEGTDASVEQFGRNFSGGQRQRLAIARTLTRAPEVLILDDASSALDFATDAHLRRAIRHDLADTTVITISQRVGAVRHADQILVLDAGSVAGLGTHEELLKNCEVYQEICNSQLSSEEAQR